MIIRRMNQLFLYAILVIFCSPVFAASELQIGERLNRGESLVSANGKYILEMRSDGLMYFHDSQGNILHVMKNGSEFAVFQGDGNFVQYSAAGVPLWSTGSPNCCTDKDGLRLSVTDDGELAILYLRKIFTWFPPVPWLAWSLGIANKYTRDTLSIGQKMERYNSGLSSQDGNWTFNVASNGNLTLFRGFVA